MIGFKQGIRALSRLKEVPEVVFVDENHQPIEGVCEEFWKQTYENTGVGPDPKHRLAFWLDYSEEVFREGHSVEQQVDMFETQFLMGIYPDQFVFC